MEILESKKRFSTELTIKKEWIPNIEFKTLYEIEILTKFSKVPNADKKALILLKKFNHHICDVNINNQTYSVNIDDEMITLSIRRLSTGERIMLMCLMANETQSNIILSNELAQLDKDKITDLINDYGKSKYITLVPPDSQCGNLLRYLFERRNK